MIIDDNYIGDMLWPKIFGKSGRFSRDLFASHLNALRIWKTLPNSILAQVGGDKHKKIRPSGWWIYGEFMVNQIFWQK